MIEWAVDVPGVRLGCGDSVHYRGDADLVFSHLYGPLPPQLVGKPAIINQYGNRQARAEEWAQAELHEVGRWGKGLTNRVYVANMMPLAVNISDLVEEEFAPGRGWMPLELPARLLAAFAKPEMCEVFDGFMGRATIGRAARDAGLSFVGIDIDPARVAIAKEYLGC